MPGLFSYEMDKLLLFIAKGLIAFLVVLLLYIFGDTTMLQSQSGVVTITDKQFVKSKKRYKGQFVGKVYVQTPYNEADYLQLIAKFNNGDVANAKVSTSDESNFIVGKTYFCMYYTTRFSKVHVITKIEPR